MTRTEFESQLAALSAVASYEGERIRVKAPPESMPRVRELVAEYRSRLTGESAVSLGGDSTAGEPGPSVPAVCGGCSQGMEPGPLAASGCGWPGCRWRGPALALARLEAEGGSVQ